jgi:hypothetical protein
MLMNKIKKINSCLNVILSKYGITDPKEQQKIIIEIINCFANRK